MLKFKKALFPMAFLFLTASPLLANPIPLEEHLDDYNDTRSYFGAYFTIHCRYDKKLTDIDAVTKKCWRKLDVVELNMNADSTQGYLGLINRAGPSHGVQVSNELYWIIKDSVEYSRRTGGAFDITVHPLVQLWKQAAKRNALPTKAEMAATLEKVGSQYIRLEPGNTVFLTRPGMSLDLNAIAPAFEVDRIAEILEANKIRHYMVDGSGEIRCKGDQSDQQRGWRVGVQDPTRKNTDSVVHVLVLKDYSVSTSGNYERFNTIQGKKYSHIIDPRTGYPANKGVSATAIAPTAEEANAYSTPLCVVGGKEGVKMVSAAKGVEAYILENQDGKIIAFESPGYRNYRAPQ